MSTSTRGRLGVWRRPLQLAALVAVGLSAALIGSGPWRLLSWVCLAIPLVVGLRYVSTGLGPPKSGG